MIHIAVKRVYDPIEPDEGLRVLVDRIWPRGISKEALKADQWLRDAAPSDPLRRWFGHDPSKWEEFKTRYIDELKAKPEITRRLLELAEEKGVTLLFAAHDIRCNQAVVLKDYLVSLTTDLK